MGLNDQSQPGGFPFVAPWAVGLVQMVPDAHGSGLSAGPHLETCTRSENRAHAGIRYSRSEPRTGCDAV